MSNVRDRSTLPTEARGVADSSIAVVIDVCPAAWLMNRA
jgi:hypothetical protein